jgi:EamA domain-containing membrane protein RarD
LQPLQWLAVAIAAAGVLIALITYGDVPCLLTDGGKKEEF